ncbi:MAG: oligoendopeptidase F [Planctomycetes bacterium]|nr:oligoendopeptidase F [Planctomycetota bacterium]
MNPTKRKLTNIILAAALITTLNVIPAISETQDRSQIPDKYKWDLTDIFKSDRQWQKAKDKFAADSEQILQHKGKLARSAADLLACLKLDTELSRQRDKTSNYASMKADQDTSNAKYLAAKQEMAQIATDYYSKASFITPEIAAMDKQKIDTFLAAEPALKDYKMDLYDILRTKAHTRSESEEKILSQASLMARAPGSIFSILTDAELPYPEVTLVDGTTVTLDRSAYAKHRASASRNDRRAVFNAFWSTFENFKLTYGAQLYGNVQSHIFYARTRNYESSLHRALDRNNIPTDVYHALIENVNNNLPTLHRYLKLKQRMLGVKTLEYSDLYAPAVKSVDLNYTFDQARDLVLSAAKPLGPEYTAAAKKAFDNRWIDVYPTPHKRSGAYAENIYDIHPYMLLNFNGKYDDVSTLAHELGHNMHSYYATKTQPYPTAGYATFVAEVASTFNEALLIDKMLNEIKDDQTRLSFLADYIENARLTMFRQTQFAEFELKIHETAESGTPLTGDKLTEIYAEIIKRYYGHDEGICHIDDLYTYEWAYIPHFYYNFYVYQYATSFTASTALAQAVLDKEPHAAEKYLDLLSAGGSNYPIDLLKKAGADMTTPKPFDKTIKTLNKVMDQIEALLDKKKK